MTQYIIQRDLTDHRKVKPWIVLKDGKPLEWQAASYGYPRRFGNACDCEAAAMTAFDQWWQNWVESNVQMARNRPGLPCRQSEAIDPQPNSNASPQGAKRDTGHTLWAAAHIRFWFPKG